MQLESELEKLKVEKDLGWVESDTNNKNYQEKEILNQEIQRLADKLKKTNHKLEELHKKEIEWNERENKYQVTCKNFKKTIAEQKKELDNAKSAPAKSTKSFETMFADHTKLKKTYEETIKLLYSIVEELTLENQVFRQERSKNRNFAIDTIEASMKLFEIDESFLKV